MGNEIYFDENVLNYDRYRPTYGQEIFADIIAYAGITENGRILEIGCGTGNATLPLVQTGADVIAVELGKNLSEYTTKKFAGYHNFRVVNLPFEEYRTDLRFDLIISATAFHWIKSDYGYPRCLDLLKDSGALALFWNTPRISDSTPVLNANIEKLYSIYLPDASEKGSNKENEYAKRCDDLNFLLETYGYHDREFKLYYNNRTFHADEYIGLLHTYSNHMALAESRRNEFFGKVYDEIKHYGSIEIINTIDLHMGRKGSVAIY